jgi:hypothetical protein
MQFDYTSEKYLPFRKTKNIIFKQKLANEPLG